MGYKHRVSYTALEQLSCIIPQSDANEALGLIVKLFDSFTRIVNNLKTSLLGFNKDFKRSELKFYHDSHAMAIKDWMKQRHFDANIMVPIPSGMKQSYLKTMDVLDDLYESLSIQHTTDAINTYLAMIKKQGHLSNADHVTSVIDRLNRADVEHHLQTVFTADKTIEEPLGHVVKDFDELLILDQRILALDKIFQSVPMICQDLDRIEQQIDDLVTHLEQDPPVDKTLVTSLYHMVFAASVQYDLLGVILAEYQRVEHNFTLVIRRMVQLAKS